MSVPITRPVITENYRIPLCENPWSMMLVDVDGSVRYCCLSEEILGNLRDQSCEQIWNGKAIQGVRRMLYEGRLPTACRQSPCKYATIFKDKPDPEAIPRLIPNPAEYKSHIESLEPVCSSQTECMKLLARVRNKGSHSWMKEKTTERVVLGARLFEKKGFLAQPVCEYRSELPNEIHPGDCAEIDLVLDFAGFRPETYVAVVDMVYESKFWFMDNMSAVWVLMLEKEKDGSVQLTRSAEITSPLLPSQEEAKCWWQFWK